MLSNNCPSNENQAEHWYWFYNQIHLIVSFWFVKKVTAFESSITFHLSTSYEPKTTKLTPLKENDSNQSWGVPKASILHAPKSNLYHWSQATDHHNVAHWLVVDLLMYIEHMTVPQNEVVAPARKSEGTNWRPQRRLLVSENVFLAC